MQEIGQQKYVALQYTDKKLHTIQLPRMWWQ